MSAETDAKLSERVVSLADAIRSANVDERSSLLETLDTSSPDLLAFIEEPPLDCDEKTEGNARLLRNALAQYRYWKRIDAPYPELAPLEGDIHPLVSVIMPVYNTSSYLDETVQSVLDQSMTDFELICINDGSTDDSIDRLESWAAKDPRVYVRSQPNQGLSAARNSGLDLARGTYLLFLDSDDLLRFDALEILSQRAQEDALDVLDFSAEAFVEEGYVDTKSLSTYYIRRGTYEGVYSGLELMLAEAAAGDYRSSAALHFMRREFLESGKHRFIRGILHEDNPFTFRLTLDAQRMALFDEGLYQRRIHDGSIMTSASTFANAIGYYLSYRDMLSVFLTIADTLDPLAYETLSRIVMKMLLAARREYGAMPAEQVGSHHGIGIYRNEFFHDVVTTRLTDERLASKDAQLRALRKEKADLEAQVNSRAHRMGVLMAKPIRMTADALRKVRQRKRG